MSRRLQAFLLCFFPIIFTHGFEKCCPELGCFELGSPWTTPIRPVPQPRCQDEIPALFYLYTRKNPYRRHNIKVWPEISLRGSKFNSRRSTVFYFHGWNSKAEGPEIEELKTAYLRAVDVNLIFVDWSSAALNHFYPQAVSDTRVVAAQASRFVNYLIYTLGASPSEMHFMGLSLGAHTAAYTARTLPRVARLTGLDPAGPLYEGNSDEVKLNVNDAAFVEVIHTNGFPLTSFGSYSPLGDVDFYFNGGVIQPGCGFGRDINIHEKLVTQNISIVNSLLQPARCSHSRSLVYYTEALKNQGCIFWGSNRRTSTLQSTPTTHETRNSNLSSLKECTLASCIPVGLKTIDYPAKGSFDVHTRSSSPFCIKHTDVDQHMMQELEEFQSQQLETIKF